MRMFVVAAVLSISMGASAQPQSVPNDGPQSPHLLDSPTVWEDWLAGLTPDQLEQVSRYNGQVSTHPSMAADTLGVSYPPIRSLPLATFHRELESYPNSQRLRLIEIFNVELISPGRRIDWPSTATLRVELSKGGRYVHLDVPMNMHEDGLYRFASPQDVLSNLGEAVDELGQFPRMQFPTLEGFTLNAETIEDMPPLGAPITYNFRFGDVRVDTGYQWAGRPNGPFNGQAVEFLK